MTEFGNRNSRNLFDPQYRRRDRSIEYLRGILNAYDPELEDKVNRTVKQWNGVIREHLRNEMGLRFTMGNERQSVPLRIIEGMPEEIRKLIDNKGFGNAWEYYSKRELFEKAKTALEVIKDKYSELVRLKSLQPPSAERSEIERSYYFINSLINGINNIKLEDEIKSIDKDVLGTYIIKESIVNIYWMVIGLISKILGVSPEALTMVVLAHELAHAYSHIGRDIDGQNWDTDSFSKSDLLIVEGLAQYYTEIVCKKLKEKHPEAVECFRKLLILQPETYNEYKNWVKEHDAAGEVIRISMIECRVNKIEKYEDFCGRISENKKKIKQPIIFQNKLFF